MAQEAGAASTHDHHGGHGHHGGHDHHGGHGHHGEVDWAARGDELARAGEVVAPMVDQALAWLAGRVPDSEHVLDVGSGPGVAACTLAQMLPRAHVLAVDGAAPLLDMAAERAARLGIAGRLTTSQVPLPEGLAELPQADLVWVSGVVHHLPDAVAGLRALGALLRPGGLLAVREGGLPDRFLPDGVAPGLLPRLEAVGEDMVAHGENPMGVVPHHGGWPELLRAAGLRPAGSRSFLLDLPAPVSAEVRQYLRWRLTMMQEFAGDRVGPADAAALSRLLDPDAPEGVSRRPDVFLLSAVTVHTAQP
jgi:SAM-dependent methyltransferase